MGFFVRPRDPRDRGTVSDDQSVRHRRRPRHAGVGLSEAEAVPAALPARERGGRRAARPLFLHRLRRLPRVPARRVRPADRCASACRVRRTRPTCSPRCAARLPPRRIPRPRPRASRCSAAWSASRATISCAISSGCRRRRGCDDDCPDAHYVAPRSLLVFDHLTRRAALLHAGSEHERQSLRREVIRALRGGLPGPAWAAKFSAPDASLSRGGVPAGRRAHQGIHRRRRRLPAGAVGALRGPLRPRSVRGVPRAAAAESLAVHVLTASSATAPWSAPRPRRW